MCRVDWPAPSLPVRKDRCVLLLLQRSMPVTQHDLTVTVTVTVTLTLTLTLTLALSRIPLPCLVLCVVLRCGILLHCRV